MLTNEPSVYLLHRPDNTFFFRGALRPQKRYGLSGTGEEWDRERELRPISRLP